MNEIRIKWFQITEVDEGIYAVVEPEHVQSFLVTGTKMSALIDTGMGFCNIRKAAAPLVNTDIVVLNTHWHYDHTGGNRLFQKIGISETERSLIEKDMPNEVLMERYIRPCLLEGIPFPDDFVPEKYHVKGSRATFSIADGDAFDLGGRVLKAISTPGHTHGSMSFMDSLTGSLFCGDFIYRGSIYAHLKESNPDEYIDSLKKVMQRYDRIKVVYAGHNDVAVPKTFLPAVLDGFLDIRSGAAEAGSGYRMEKDVSVYSFGAFNILTRAPGTGGVEI